MLTEKEIEIINQNLKSGFDVEIQQRKSGIAIQKIHKDLCYKRGNLPQKQEKNKIE